MTSSQNSSSISALVALAPTGELVAVARYFVLEDRPRAAEVAIAVADEWQHRGVGTADDVA